MKDYLYTIWLRKKKKKEGGSSSSCWRLGVNFNFKDWEDLLLILPELWKEETSSNDPPFLTITPFENSGKTTASLLDYGCLRRQEVLWPYICINEDYVDAWITAQPNRKEYLSLTALLRACLNHELGHWVQTLVTSSSHQCATNFHLKKVGYLSTKALRSHPKSPSAPWTGWRGSWGLCGSL